MGDKVLGFADFANYPSAGASDVAVLDHWAKVPAGLDMNLAAALPMAAIIGHHALDALGVKSGQTLLVHGGGTFPLEQWREAMEISMSGKASGKLLLLPSSPSSPGSP